MKDSYEQRIQNQFGAFCVKVLKNEARHIQRDYAGLKLFGASFAPFPCPGNPAAESMLLDKESPLGSIRQTDTICLCGAGRPVRHDPVASPQDGTTVTGERTAPDRKTSVAACGR